MSEQPPRYPTLEDVIGNTPLARLVRVPGAENEQRGKSWCRDPGSANLMSASPFRN